MSTNTTPFWSTRSKVSFSREWKPVHNELPYLLHADQRGIHNTKTLCSLVVGAHRWTDADIFGHGLIGRSWINVSPNRILSRHHLRHQRQHQDIKISSRYHQDGGLVLSPRSTHRCLFQLHFQLPGKYAPHVGYSVLEGFVSTPPSSNRVPLASRWIDASFRAKSLRWTKGLQSVPVWGRKKDRGSPESVLLNASPIHLLFHCQLKLRELYKGLQSGHHVRNVSWIRYRHDSIDAWMRPYASVELTCLITVIELTPKRRA